MKYAIWQQGQPGPCTECTRVGRVGTHIWDISGNCDIWAKTDSGDAGNVVPFLPHSIVHSDIHNLDTMSERIDLEDCSRTNCFNANPPKRPPGDHYISSEIDWNSVINNIDRLDYSELTVIGVIGRLVLLLQICDCWSVFWCDDSMGHVSHAHPGGH